MGSQMIKMDDKSFSYKIKLFFSKIAKFFNKNIIEERLAEVSKKDNKKDFMEELKKNNAQINNINDINNKSEFLEKIDGNREMLENLSIERLEKLEKYYVEIIKQNDILIKKLSENV